jgi:hypothetical protein
MTHDTNDVKQRVESEYQREEQTVDTSDEADMMSIAFCAVATAPDEAAFSFF